MAVPRYRPSPLAAAVLVVVVAFLGSACRPAVWAVPVPSPSATAELQPSQVITLGDIEPDDPLKKFNRFKPLADYLAGRLGDLGFEAGDVVLARDIEEMATLMADGDVDVYFDSTFPTLAVQDLSGSRIILRRWKDADPEYWSTYVALRDNGVSRLEDFRGKVIAFEEPHSTSGFVLPAGTLVDRGFRLREVDAPSATVAADEVGYVFSRDEQNTIELLLQRRVAGGGVSNQDYDKMPPELQEQINAFDRTITVPRQLVSVSPGLGDEVVDRIQQVLVDLELTDEGQQLLEGLKNTKRFDPLPDNSGAAVEELRRLMRLLP